MKSLAIEPACWQPLESGDIDTCLRSAWEQSQTVFIDACALPARAPTMPCLRLLETAFGLGINFLATWAWLKKSGSKTRLRYVAIENHPFAPEDLRAALAIAVDTAPEHLKPLLGDLAERLQAAWPPLIPGFHTLALDEQTTLTLIFGDIHQVLPTVQGRFDAFYLSDCTPDDHAERCSPESVQAMAQLAAPGARLSGQYVAGDTRSALVTAGFALSQAQGCGSNRDRVWASWPGSLMRSPELQLPVIVIGAGIAGASIARQLADRGVAVTVIEKDRPACGGSGNPVAVVRAEPGGDDNPIAAFSAAGVLWLAQWLALYGGAVSHEFCGALRMTRDERRHDKLALQAQTLPASWLQEVDAQKASALCGQAVSADAFLLPDAAWIVPALLVEAMLDHPGISLKTGVEAQRLVSSAEGWQLHLSDGSAMQASRIVLADALGSLSPVPLAVDRARGQLSSLPAREGRELHMIVCRDGYITPAIQGVHTVGATIQYDDEETTARRLDDEENFHRLQRLLPGFAASVDELTSSRVSWRATTQDRLPLVGKIADGLFASLGHGSRGVTCAPLCAEWLASMMCDEPLPLGSEWVARLDPLRFG